MVGAQQLLGGFSSSPPLPLSSSGSFWGAVLLVAQDSRGAEVCVGFGGLVPWHHENRMALSVLLIL